LTSLAAVNDTLLLFVCDITCLWALTHFLITSSTSVALYPTHLGLYLRQAKTTSENIIMTKTVLNTTTLDF